MRLAGFGTTTCGGRGEGGVRPGGHGSWGGGEEGGGRGGACRLEMASAREEGTTGDMGLLVDNVEHKTICGRVWRDPPHCGRRKEMRQGVRLRLRVLTLP